MSHSQRETQGLSASQDDKENHLSLASHYSLENHKEQAGQPQRETLTKSASQKAEVEPVGFSEPVDTSNPSYNSEPSKFSNPLCSSEPFPGSNPVGLSEPAEIRNPSESSEPPKSSNPYPSSEPQNVRNPSPRSGPLNKSNPSAISEPEDVSNPKLASEPEEVSNPVPESEPSDPSNPSRGSEPIETSNPNPVSGPPLPSKPKGTSVDKIRPLVEIFYDVQDVRIRSFNRLREVGEVKGVNPDILKELEKQIRDYIKVEIRDIPIVATYLRSVKGIGPILAGGLISWFDPHKAPHISSFWKYAGLSVSEGRAVKREKGKKADYNPTAKVLCWKIASSFIKCRSPFYRPLYDKAKLEEAEKLRHPEEDPGNCPMFASCSARLSKTAERKGREVKKLPCKKHIDYRARRKMVKRFLADLWCVWRSLEGLPVTEPYAVQILGHSKVLEALK